MPISRSSYGESNVFNIYVKVVQCRLGLRVLSMETAACVAAHNVQLSCSPRLNARSVCTTAELFSAADGRLRIPLVMKNVSDSYPCIWLQ